MKPYYVDIHSHHHLNNRDKLESNTIKVINHEWNKPKPDSDYFSASLHPWSLPKDIETGQLFLKESYTNKKYIALGEIGLDKKCKTPWSIQIDHFKAALLFAKNNSISPIILHSVKSHAECIKEINKIELKGHFIFHDYHGSIEQTLAILKDNRFSISLGSLLNRPHSKLTSYLKDLPLDKLFLETDDDRRSIEAVYEQFCAITGHDIQEVKSICYNSFIKLFPGILND